MLGFASRRARFFVRLDVLDWVTWRRKRPPNRTDDRLLAATLLRSGRLHRRCSGILRDAIAASRKCQYGFWLSEGEGKRSYWVRTLPACLGFVRLLLARADEALDCNRGFLSLSLLEIVHPTAHGRNHGWRLALVLTGRTAVRLVQDALFTLNYSYNFLL